MGFLGLWVNHHFWRVNDRTRGGGGGREVKYLRVKVLLSKFRVTSCGQRGWNPAQGFGGFNLPSVAAGRGGIWGCRAPKNAGILWFIPDFFSPCVWIGGRGFGNGALVGRREQRGWRGSRCPVLQEGTMSPGPGQQQKEEQELCQSPAGAGRRPGKEGKSAQPTLLSTLSQPHNPPGLGLVCLVCFVKANDDFMLGREALESHSGVRQSGISALVGGGFKSQLNLIFWFILQVLPDYIPGATSSRDAGVYLLIYLLLLAREGLAEVAAALCDVGEWITASMSVWCPLIHINYTGLHWFLALHFSWGAGQHCKLSGQPGTELQNGQNFPGKGQGCQGQGGGWWSFLGNHG